MNSKIEQGRVYNLSLLFSFVANVFQLISVSLLFRYADFIDKIGGDEWHLGWIVGAAAIGAVGSRLYIGKAIDRFGPEWVWMISLIGQMAGLYWHVFVTSPTGLSVFLARGLYATSLAGTFGSWLSFVSLRAPENRVAEVIGVVGSSGFVGMAIGPVLGDWLFQANSDLVISVQRMFHVAILTVAASLVAAIAASRSGVRVQLASQKKSQNVLQIISEAKPGFVLIMGALMGLTIGFPGTYLRPFAASINVEQIKWFFLTYNATAFISRLLFRRAPQTLGLPLTIIVGYLLMIASMLCYLLVEDEFGLIWPAFMGGLAHSFLFPAVIALCTEKFRIQDRGVASNLILAMYDLGVLVGMPTIGIALTLAGDYDIPPYSSVFVALSLVILATVGMFAQNSNRKTSP